MGKDHMPLGLEKRKRETQQKNEVREKKKKNRKILNQA